MKASKASVAKGSPLPSVGELVASHDHIKVVRSIQLREQEGTVIQGKVSARGDTAKSSAKYAQGCGGNLTQVIAGWLLPALTSQHTIRVTNRHRNLHAPASHRGSRGRQTGSPTR